MSSILIKLFLLLVLAISSSDTLMSGENCLVKPIQQTACQAAPLNLVPEESASLLEESSPLYILTTI
jgi:hypothetical protein